MMPATADKLEDKYEHLVIKFISDLNNGKIEGSAKVALATVALLEQIISDAQHASALELVRTVSLAGKLLLRAAPHEVVASNMVRRVLRVIRDEHNQCAGAGTSEVGESLQRLVRAAARRGTVGPSSADLKSPTLQHIAELRAELEGSADLIAEQATDHIHADELVLTYGASRLAERFLRRAAASRAFRLVLVQGIRTRACNEMAARLTSHGVQVTLADLSHAFTLMSRVNKVLVGARGVLSGGALLAAPGAHTLALAARHYSVPMIVLAPLYKLSPAHACDQPYFKAFQSPEQSLPYEMGAGCDAQILSPLYDHVPADLVTLFITNLGGSSPSYVYRLLSELYDPRDYQMV